MRCLSFLLFAVPLTTSAGPLTYNRDVRPILAENCFACHGPDSASRKADLRLDRREDAVKAKAIVPGSLKESEMVRRILSDDPQEVMPTPMSHKKLSDAQKKTLQDWVAAGAEYQPHWSFLPPVRPAIPAVKNSAWVKNPIDAFVLAELEKRNLTPAPEADRRTLARRLSLDLIGLPPEPAVVEAFVNDASPDAYEKLVAKFMAMPQWGEHRGRIWLDVARFADTHGIHMDNYREMWAYRDWVIDAFNKNMAFDQFTIEQLAGDLLPNRTLAQQVASGFNRCNITTSEGGSIAEEYLVLYTRDRTETTAQAWLGLTAGCAVCHDHKFDPISQKEFYRLAAFFNNTTQKAMDGNVRDTPPIVTVPTLADVAKFEALQKQVEAIVTQLEAKREVGRKQFDTGKAGPKASELSAGIPSKGLILHVPLSEAEGATLSYRVNGEAKQSTQTSHPLRGPGYVSASAIKTTKGKNPSFDHVPALDGKKPFTVSTWVRLARRGTNGAIVAAMDDQAGHRGWDIFIQADKPAFHLVSAWPNDAVKVASNDSLKAGTWHQITVTSDGSGKAAGVRMYIDGKATTLKPESDKLKGPTTSHTALTIGQRRTEAGPENAEVQDVRLYDRALGGEEALALTTATRGAYLVGKGKLTPAEKNELFEGWISASDVSYRELLAKKAKLETEQAPLKSSGTIAHVMQEKPDPAMAFILKRGEYDRRLDKVEPGTPAALPAFGDDLPKNRLGFAQWLLRPDHPLTARVTVNRFWQDLFGNGIVRTSGDFGITGDLPTHPELLDWLALEFRDQAWDVKKFYTMLVMSNTYRQSAVTTPEKRERDAANRYLSRGPRFRLDAETIRDSALAASGILVSKIGGASVKPYQPEGVWEAVAMPGSNTRSYKADTGENLYRRSMYTFWKRAAPPASMEILNAPNRETCAVKRERTNTPLQALVTLNDPQFVEAARFLAQRTMKENATPEARIDFMARRILARPFTDEETRIVRASAEELLTYYKANSANAKKLIAVGESKADATLNVEQLAAYTMLANELMNLDEFLNK